MNFGEILLGTLTGALATIGESKLMEVLQELHDKDETPEKEQYKSVILGGASFCSGISALVKKSKTGIDDAILQSIKDAVTMSAAANGIELP